MAQVRLKRPTKTRQSVWLWVCLAISFLFWTIPEESLDKETLALTPPLDHYLTAEEVLDHPEYVYKRKCQGQSRATLASIKDCYPDATIQFYGNRQNCTIPKETEPLSWSFVQQCVSGKSFNNGGAKITQIHIIGERNSGTKWLQQELALCFSRSLGIRSHRDFLRSKHFFQPPVRETMENSLVIAIVRSPEEWVAAMREKPYHMPHHMKGFDYNQPQKLPPVPLEWKEFLNRPWTMPEKTPEDVAIIKAQEQNSRTCVQGFSFFEVSPCIFNDTKVIPRSKWRGHMPIYEMQRDGSGRPFDDIMKLRFDKILNFFLEVPLLIKLGGFIAVRYEDLMMQGTQSFLERVAKIVGMSTLPSTCKPQLPRPNQLGHRQVPVEARQWIQEKLVQETEHLLGYR